ncbi:hypothetical protein [Bacillus sp. 0102A]|uniref:hypothetical protein n=1 Tax=Bacillus sp. 0102A TaxID=3120563 RepID=UPI002FD8AE97
MKNKRGKTLRLLMRQWQGGNNPPYVLGAHLFNGLAPKTNDPFEEKPGCSQSPLMLQDLGLQNIFHEMRITYKIC